MKGKDRPWSNFSHRIIFCIISNLELDQSLNKSIFGTINRQDFRRIDEPLLAGMILTDLTKTFDTTNREVLLQELKAIRFSEQSIQWFRFYLYDIIFLVQTENLSEFGKISYGVLQDFILVPPLFFIHVTDMPHVVKSNFLL